MTPRLGLGIARGHVDPLVGATRSSGVQFLSEPIAEAGVTVFVQVAPRLSLAFDGYALKSLIDETSQRTLLLVGGGVGLVFGGRGTPKAREVLAINR